MCCSCEGGEDRVGRCACGGDEECVGVCCEGGEEYVGGCCEGGEECVGGEGCVSMCEVVRDNERVFSKVNELIVVT